MPEEELSDLKATLETDPEREELERLTSRLDILLIRGTQSDLNAANELMKVIASRATNPSPTPTSCISACSSKDNLLSDGGGSTGEMDLLADVFEVPKEPSYGSIQLTNHNQPPFLVYRPAVAE